MTATPSPVGAPISGRHRVAIIGGGSAGISVAARLRRSGVTDISLIEPSETHWYQPLWTLVGGGQAPCAAPDAPKDLSYPTVCAGSVVAPWPSTPTPVP